VGFGAARLVGRRLAFVLEGLTGIHRMDPEFGGIAPAFRLAVSAEYRLGERWLAGLLAYRSTALNREYADVMGELPAYTMIGVTLRYRLNVTN
jgi:hypothetical protein